MVNTFNITTCEPDRILTTGDLLFTRLRGVGSNCHICIRFSWGNMQSDDPILVARNTVFFKTVEMALHEGRKNPFGSIVYLPIMR